MLRHFEIPMGASCSFYQVKVKISGWKTAFRYVCVVIRKLWLAGWERKLTSESLRSLGNPWPRESSGRPRQISMDCGKNLALYQFWSGLRVDHPRDFLWQASFWKFTEVVTLFYLQKHFVDTNKVFAQWKSSNRWSFVPKQWSPIRRRLWTSKGLEYDHLLIFIFVSLMRKSYTVVCQYGMISWASLRPWQGKTCAVRPFVATLWLPVQLAATAQ